MNKLPAAKRAQILTMMVEGVSIRAISRMTGASKNTIAKLLADAGQACAEYQDNNLRGLTCKRLQVDEIWSLVYAKAKNVPTAKAAPEVAGDVWTWTAIDADTKLIPSFFVGGRDAYAANVFIRDLADRLSHRVQLTSDGHKPYLDAVERAFGNDIDYAMLVKHYGPAPEGQRRYSPAECVGTTVGVVTGQPGKAHISTSYSERSNLSIRMGVWRFTRLTNAFSKKVGNHFYALAIYFMHYNYVRIHTSLRVTPAMAAGMSKTLWTMDDVVKMVEEWEAAQTAESYKLEPAQQGSG
jgi:IS1 family transposase